MANQVRRCDLKFWKKQIHKNKQPKQNNETTYVKIICNLHSKK